MAAIQLMWACKSLCVSPYQISTAGHIEDVKAENQCHFVVISIIEEFHNNKFAVFRPYSFLPPIG